MKKGNRVIVNDEWQGYIDSIHKDTDNILYATIIDQDDNAFDIPLDQITIDE